MPHADLALGAAERLFIAGDVGERLQRAWADQRERIEIGGAKWKHTVIPE